MHDAGTLNVDEDDIDGCDNNIDVLNLPDLTIPGILTSNGGSIMLDEVDHSDRKPFIP